ncbi:MAG: tetratricopeptide repeat protein, partial [Gemmata sp.]
AAAPGTTDGRRDALARYGAAVLNLRRDRLLTAARQFEAAAKADPDAAAPLKELAKLYSQIGREPEAIRLARRVLDKDPADHDTALLLARLLFDAGEPKEAVAAARLAADSKALAERPEKAVRAYRYLATLCEKTDDLATAELMLRKAVEVVTTRRAEAVKSAAFTPKEADIEAAECLERLGHLLVKARKFTAAVEAYRAAAALYADRRKADDPPGAARLAWNLSGALQAKGDPADALPHLEEFLKLQPQAAEPYQRLAQVLRAAGRADQVAPALRKCADGDPLNRPLTAVLAAELAADPGTRADADKLFAALAGVTSDPKVVAVVVRSHLDTRRPGEIIADLDRAFVALDAKKKEKPDGPGAAGARQFAADKARAIGDALRDDPDGVAALLRAAAEDLRTGTKRNHGTYYFLGALARRHHKLDLAAAQFRQAALRAPKELQMDAYAALIDALWHAHKPGEVEAVCRDGIDAQGNAIPVYFQFHLARALAEQGKADEALATADKAILAAADTDRLAVRLRRHLVLRALGKWDDAIEYGKKLLEEFDTPAGRPAVRHAQALACWGAKKPAEAEALLRAILDDDADDAGACNDLGYHLADQGRNLDEAERLVRHALALDRAERRKAGSPEPDNAAYRDSLGWVLFRQGKVADARAELEKALALPDGAADATVWDHYGDVLFRANEKAKARAAWEKAKELYATDPRPATRAARAEVARKLQRTAP